MYLTTLIDWMGFTVKPIDTHIDDDGTELPKGRFNSRYYKKPWGGKAEHMLDALEASLGKSSKDDLSKLAKLGYTQSRTYASGAVVGYHELNEYMGIHIQFTGDGLKALRKVRGAMAERDVIHETETIVNRFNYDWRMTRIDITDDIHESKWTIPQFASLLVSDEQTTAKGEIWRARNLKNGVDFVNARVNTRAVVSPTGSTVYMGTKASGKESRLYNKTAERANAGENIEADLLRFEVSYSKEFATQVGNVIYSSPNHDNMIRSMNQLIYSDFNIRKPRGGKMIEHPLMKEIKKVADGGTIIMHADKTESDFESAYRHIVEKSGLMSMIEKAVRAFPETDSEAIIDGLFDNLKMVYREYHELESTSTNPDIKAFVNRFNMQNPDKDIQALPWHVVPTSSEEDD